MEAGDRPEIKKRGIGELGFSYLSGSGGEIPAIGRSNLSHFGRLSGSGTYFHTQWEGSRCSPKVVRKSGK